MSTETPCTVQTQSEGTAEAKLTVGQVFALNCQGDFSKQDAKTAVFKLAEADAYKIKLLSADFSASQAKLLVASYVPGDHQLQPLVLVSGSESLELSGVRFHIESVQDPQSPKTEPYGPLSPLGLSLPWWYFAILALVVVFILLAVWRRFRRWQQKRKLIADLEAQGAAIEPFPQFAQALRRLQRQYSFLDEAKEAPVDLKQEFVGELEKSYRTYLGRSFLIPTFTWKDSLILKDLRSSHKNIFRDQGAVIDQLFSEFAQAKTQKELVKNRDLKQLFDLARKNIDEIHVQLKGGEN